MLSGYFDFRSIVKFFRDNKEHSFDSLSAVVYTSSPWEGRRGVGGDRGLQIFMDFVERELVEPRERLFLKTFPGVYRLHPRLKNQYRKIGYLKLNNVIGSYYRVAGLMMRMTMLHPVQLNYLVMDERYGYFNNFTSDFQFWELEAARQIGEGLWADASTISLIGEA
jgi:hypothetical protein